MTACAIPMELPAARQPKNLYICPGARGRRAKKGGPGMANTNLAAARAAKNDEFYTQYHDIEAELAARYERDAYEYLAVAYPGEDPR